MIVLLSLLDCVLTLAGVSMMGLDYEANPLCTQMLRVSPLLFVAVKMIPAVILAVLIRRSRRFSIPYAIVNGIYGAVILINCAALLTLGGIL